MFCLPNKPHIYVCVLVLLCVLCLMKTHDLFHISLHVRLYRVLWCMIASVAKELKLNHVHTVSIPVIVKANM